ncbi:hypothetical protein [Flammeovirga pacifica]|uniref:Uncharacterized protein n=1 Tax=Flammeovirga pacifica TaxID=915059 RepID=A0A1S1Z062_FLAPC|nr:hypothetical protein [Flammeovirga pacifica]OHX66656.1 hypothetical protein NH26_09935 [Flammeovirga pacifica]
MQAYNILDQHIHQLCQVIAKFNRAFVPKKADDSHTNLQFDIVGERVVGRWVTTEKRKVIMGFHVPSQTFHLYSENWSSLFSLETIGKTQEEIENAWEATLKEWNLSFSEFIAPLHYEIPVYDFLSTPYTKFNQNDMYLWMTYRALASEICFDVLNHVQVEGEVRIWPHHFDTGIYVEATPNVGLGFGLAMKDSILEASYFYYSAYGLNGHSIDYTQLSSLSMGEWIIQEHWKGAVIGIDHTTRNTLHQFIKEVTEQYI